MLFMFFTISNRRRALSEENEVLLHIAFININVQQAALQDQVFRNPGSQTVQSERVKAGVGYIKTFLLHENVVAEQEGNNIW